MDPGTKSIGARRHQGGTGEAPGRHRGGTEEAPRRHRGGNGALGGPPYEVLRTTNRSSEDLTRRWARGPANLNIPTDLMITLAHLWTQIGIIAALGLVTVMDRPIS